MHKEKSLLIFEETKFSFIYDFVFKADKWVKLSHFYNGMPEERLGWVPSKITNKIIDTQKYLWFDVNSFANELAFDTSKDFLSQRGIIGQEDCAMKIAVLIRIKKTGLGTVTIILDKKDCQIDFDGLKPFCTLIPTTWNQVMNNTESELSNDNNYVTKIKIDGQESFFTLQDLFFEILERLKSNGILEDILDKKSNIFNNLRPSEFERLITQNNEQKHNEIRPKTIDPYVHFAGKLNDKLYDQLFFDSGQFNPSTFGDLEEHEYNNYIKQILAILYRFFDLSQYKFLSIDYLRKEFDFSKHGNYPRLISNNANSNYFSYIHRMSSVSIYHRDKGIPYEMIDKTINDMLENARVKLRGLNYANSQLDNLMEKISEESYSPETVTDILSILIEIQKIVTNSLADLSILLYDGQVAYDIIELVYNKMNINQLNKAVFDKITMVRHLIEDYRSFEMLSKLNKLKNDAIS